MKTRIGLAVVALTALVAGYAPAGIIYQETFNTDTSNLLTTYGFSASGSGSNYRATGGVAQFDSTGNVQLGAALPSGFAYDWSQPLTISADLASTAVSGSWGVIGISLGTGTSLGHTGLSFTMYWPEAYGWIGFADTEAEALITVSKPPTLLTANTSYNLSLTIRQNTTDAGKFDFLAAINGTAITESWGGAWPVGVAADGDWITGIYKSRFGIDGADPFNSIGIGSRLGGTQTQSLDNLTLSVIPEPATLSMIGVIGIAMLLRRRLVKV